MELNGLANISVIIQIALEDKKIDMSTAVGILEQLELLERYMLAYGTRSEGIEKGLEYFQGPSSSSTYWHEILQNPKA